MMTKKKQSFLPYGIIGVLFFYIGHYIVRLYETAPVENSGAVFSVERFDWTFNHLFDRVPIDFSFSMMSLYVGALCFLGVLLIYFRFVRLGVYRRGEEHGSAEYATLKDIQGFADENEEYNMILTKNGRIGLYNKRLDYHNQTNKNVFVLGGSGDGKTFTVIKPNALQLTGGSKIFTDTKGLLVHEIGHFFDVMDYRVLVFDLITFQNSNCFNVFRYMKSELDIDRVATAIVTATKKSDNSGEDFWVQAEMLLMRALIGYLYFDSQISGYEPNLPQVTDLVRHLERKDPEVPSPVERLFDELNMRLPNNYACKQWELFNTNFNGETRKSVTAIMAARFSVFDHVDVRKLLERDTLHIEKWNTEKTAVFINIPESNEAYQFISALLFSTVLDTSIRIADDILKGNLNKELLHLEIWGDEFAQIGKIPDLEKYIAVLRSREISIKIMLQSEAQLDSLYGKDKRRIILNNCASILYLGTNDKETSEAFSARVGNQTINDDNYSESMRQNGSNTQHSKLKRELLNSHEIMTLPLDEALLFINRQNVFRDKKANVSEHKYAHLLANSPNDRTWYRYKRYMNDIEEFLSAVRPSQIVEVTQEEIEAFTG